MKAIQPYRLRTEQTFEAGQKSWQYVHWCRRQPDVYLSELKLLGGKGTNEKTPLKNALDTFADIELNLPWNRSDPYNVAIVGHSVDIHCTEMRGLLAKRGKCHLRE